jgi:hypothetical protein
MAKAAQQIDIESYAFGVMNAGAELVASGEVSVDDMTLALVDAVQRRFSVTFAEAEGALVRACAKMKDRSCN